MNYLLRARRDDLSALTDWLAHEPELRGRVRQATATPGPGELGAVADALIVAVGSGGALSVLAASLKTFFAHRQQEITIVVTDRQSGHTVKVDAKRVPDAEALLARVLDEDRP